MASRWSDYAADGILRDGTSVHIRAIRPDDRGELARGFAELSPESVYFRFFRVKQRLTDEELTRFTELDFVRAAALVAILRIDDEERIIGTARYAVTDDAPGPPHRAEVAFTVGDAFQGRGVGTLLLEHLIVIARANGITEFEAEVLGENNRMLNLFAKSGFRVKRSLADGVFHITFPTEETAEHAAATGLRTRVAAAESLRAIVAPRAVAVVGASRRPGSIGAALLANLRETGFTGTIHPVNPYADTIAGLPCSPTVQAIGQSVDLAVVAVPAAAVLEAARDCARAGVRAMVVISSGFAELSEAGQRAQQELVALVRSSGMRLVGPNSMGVLNTDPAIALNATFAASWPAAGRIGMLSQSGALGLAILDRLRDLNLGLSTFVSVGNKADVSGNDLLAYCADDPRTGVVLLYLESFGNPRHFARLAPLVARQKPIVAVKSGRAAVGGRGALRPSADDAADALFEHAGVIRTPTLEGMFDVAALLSTQPVPRGPRVGVVTNAGGPGALFADACEARGLELPPPSDTTLERLGALLPPGAILANPFDLHAAATPEQYAHAVAAMGGDPGVDAVSVLYVPPVVTRPDDVAAAIARGAGMVPRDKPVLAVFLSARGAPALLGTGPRGAIPSYSFPENAAEALAAAVRWNQWRRKPAGTALTLGTFSRDAIRAVVDRVLAGAGQPIWLEPHDLATILRAAGIGFAEIMPTTPSGAVAAAGRLGYPLVAKAVSPGLLPDSDLRGVELGLDDPDAVAAAVARLSVRLAAHGRRLEGVLLQREVRGGIDAAVGVTTEPTLGPLVTCGIGGPLVELLGDVAYRVPPVTDVAAEEMLLRLRTARVLAGYRGAAPGDRPALASLIQRVSALSEIVPELLALDLHPVKVLTPGRGCVVVDGRMGIAPIGGLPGPLGRPAERPGRVRLTEHLPDS
jgi:acyl-CoA synthetase (NDP forming)/RimJ/RimL family protein N-acetyltransferase